MARLSLLFFFFVVSCGLPEYSEVKNLVQVTRYLNASRLEKDFNFRREHAMALADPKYSALERKRWGDLQTTIWDFSSFHESFYEVTLAQLEEGLWDKPLEFYDSKIAKKLQRSMDLYYDHAEVMRRDFKENEISTERRALIHELAYLGFDLGLEEDIARLLTPLFAEARYKVEHGIAPDSEDKKIKKIGQSNLRSELRHLRQYDRLRMAEERTFAELAIRVSLLTEDELRILIHEQGKEENADMLKLERIALAESMALQIEDFLAAEN